MASIRYTSLALLLLAAASTNFVNASQMTDAGTASMDVTAATSMLDSSLNTDVNDHNLKSDVKLIPGGTLKQVHVITRHGARTMLSKDADSLAEAAGVTLTPSGQKQLRDLGIWLRQEYLPVLGKVSEDTETKRSLDYYNPGLHRFEASNLDRTLTSANALAKGLFPSSIRASGAHNTPPEDPLYETTELFESDIAIPVYTTGKDQNDILLRAYKNCPTFTDRLTKKLYKSREWKKLEEDNKDILVQIAQYFPDQAVNGEIPLKDAWNIYDAMHVAKTECVEDQENLDHCRAFLTRDEVVAAETALTSQDFIRLENLVEHVEFLKFGAGMDTDPSEGVLTAGNLLGSNLLWRILNRSKGEGNFFLYSAHIGTLLGTLSTLQASKDFFRDTGEKFLEYGSALIVEIHTGSDGQYYFVLKYKALDKDFAVEIMLKESRTGIKCGTGAADDWNSWCLLNAVQGWASLNTITSEEAWCKACNNQEADVCIAKGGRSQTSEIDVWAVNAQSMGYANAPGATKIICLLFFGGFSLGVLLMGMVWWCSREKQYTVDPNFKVSPKNKHDLGMMDDSTSSQSGSIGKEEPVEIDGILKKDGEFDDVDMSAEKLNGKDIC